MTPAAIKKMRRLAKGLTPEDLRALADELRWPQEARRQLPDLIDVLIVEHHGALLDRLELRINEAAKGIAD